MKKRNILISYLFLISVLFVGVQINLNAQENISVSKETEIQKNRAAGIFDLPDDELEQCFIDNVNGYKPGGATWTLNTMPETELQYLDYYIDIDGVDYDVKSLNGLEYYIQKGLMTTLKSVYFTNLSKIDITPVLNWEGIETLEFKNIPLGDVDLSGKNLPDLNSLSFVNTNTSNIIGLDEIPNLGLLDLSNNNISDVSFLNGLSLFYIDLSENQLKDIYGIDKMDYTEMRYLYLNDNMIEDFSPVSPLLANIASSLGEISFFNNRIYDYTFLEPYWDDIAGGTLHWAKDDQQQIVKDLGYIEDLSDVPTTFDIKLPNGTTETIDLKIDVSSITDYNDYSFTTPYSIDIPNPNVYLPPFPITGDITINFSYVAPTPLTPLDPSIPITVDPTKPGDSIDTSDSSNKSEVNVDKSKEKNIIKNLIETGKENVVIIFSFIILLISLRVILLNKRV